MNRGSLHYAMDSRFSCGISKNKSSIKIGFFIEINSFMQSVSQFENCVIMLMSFMCYQQGIIQ